MNLAEITKNKALELDVDLEAVPVKRGTFYDEHHERTLVVKGLRGNDHVFFKTWANDPRGSDEYEALFHLQNYKYPNDSFIQVPELIEGKDETPYSGWMVTKEICAEVKTTLPRKEIVRAYMAYRKFFDSLRPHRSKNLMEILPAGAFHGIRLRNWVRIASQKEAAGGDRYLSANPVHFERVFKSIADIETYFYHAKTEWCHGHIQGDNMAHTVDDKMILYTFAHMGWYPHYYEPAMIIWHESIMAPLRLGTLPTREDIFVWVQLFMEEWEERGIQKNKESLLKAIDERILGTILVDLRTIEASQDFKESAIKELMKFVLR